MSNYKGQSLFEVIFAIGITALVLVGALSLSTTSVRNSNFSKNNSLATKYAQEGMEWIREQRDSSWSNLTSHPGTSCISNPPAWGGSCTIATGFSRNVTLTTISADEINVIVRVTWQDGQGSHEVKSATTFTRWK